jgi:glutamate/tyrosine decarboxylase-like PLP-dependent enzyme
VTLHRLTDTEIIDQLAAMKTADVRWREGRVFSLAYFVDDATSEIADRAHRMFAGDNGLNTAAFPSLQRIQDDLVSTVRTWCDGDADTAGFVTSGGTESLLLAVKAARERGRTERGITEPNVVLPMSAHAALEKGCYYFGVESRRVPVGSDWRADVAAMADATDENTVLLVASAPQYPQGVIDPVEAIAALAEQRNINCHVDACMGGVTLHYMSRLGMLTPHWNFRVAGVTSISVDLHKYGYATKGCGVLIHRNRQLRAHQTFMTDRWLGGRYGSSGFLGTKGGGPWAAAWAVMHHLGDEGYLDATRDARNGALLLAEAVNRIPGLTLLAPPDTTLVAFTAAGGSTTLAAALKERGWYVDQQGPPPSLHCTVHAGHVATLPAFIADLEELTARLGANGVDGEGTYGSVE